MVPIVDTSSKQACRQQAIYWLDKAIQTHQALLGKVAVKAAIANTWATLAITAPND